MDIKKGQWFKCIKEMKIGRFVLFVNGSLYKADRDGSIDGVDHGVCFEEFFEPIEIDKYKNSADELEKAASEWNSKASFSPFYMVMDGDNPIDVKQDITTHADSFKAGSKWQRERDILKACIWIRENAARYVVNTSIHGTPVTALHASLDDDFKKYLEENL